MKCPKIYNGSISVVSRGIPLIQRIQYYVNGTTRRDASSLNAFHTIQVWANCDRARSFLRPAETFKKKKEAYLKFHNLVKVDYLFGRSLAF